MITLEDKLVRSGPDMTLTIVRVYSTIEEN